MKIKCSQDLGIRLLNYLLTSSTAMRNSRCLVLDKLKDPEFGKFYFDKGAPLDLAEPELGAAVERFDP